MEVNLTLVLIAAALVGCGIYLLLERSLSRVLIGLILLGNGVAVGFMVASGPAGKAPILVDGVKQTDISDPIPQAMVLTAIVIMLATTAFVLAMAYRSWQLNGHDDVQDDPEDALIRRLALHDATSDSFAHTDEDDVEAEPSSDFSEDELGPEDPDQAINEAIHEATDEAGTAASDAEPQDPAAPDVQQDSPEPEPGEHPSERRAASGEDVPLAEAPEAETTLTTDNDSTIPGKEQDR